MTVSSHDTASGFFHRHHRAVLAGLLLAGCLIGLLLLELVARFLLGLGDPVLYRSSPLYGYRPQPNQLVHRQGGAEIRINNLGLRADSDWDSIRANKVLFLGNSVTYGGSYIGTKELFSHLAVQEFDGYLGGNGGVNGWGVENIHAFIVDGAFMPAQVYVSVLQEMDFYRGLSRLAGKAFWSHKPLFAFQELLVHFHLNQFESIYKNHDGYVTEQESVATVIRSVRKLKEMDEVLKSKGYHHLIYLSTNTYQLFDGLPLDERVMTTLSAQGLTPILIKEREELARLSAAEQRELFHDWNHLSAKGHRVWAGIIRNDLRPLLTTLPAPTQH